MTSGPWPRIVLFGLLASLTPDRAPAHADIHERIDQADRQIAQDPSQGALYLKRAELRQLHGEWQACLADLDRAERHGIDPVALLFYRGRLWSEAGKPERAKYYLDRFLAERPDHAGALLIRARLITAEPSRAVADLDHVIRILDSPTPELFIERARLQKVTDDPHAALAGIDQGIDTLGPVVTLIDTAVHIAAGAGDYRTALAYLDRLPPTVRNQPAWLVRRAELLFDAGLQQQAGNTFSKALAAIENLPQHRRATRAIQSIEARARKGVGDK